MPKPTSDSTLNAGHPEGRSRTLPAEFRAQMFRPGQTGNAGGMSPAIAECRRLARASAPAAMHKLVELMGHPDARIALVAAQAVLDRGLGKPKPSEDAPDPRSPEMEQLRAGAYGVVMQLLEERARAKSAAVDAVYVSVAGEPAR